MSAVDAMLAPARPQRAVSTRFMRSELSMVFRRRRNQVVLAVLALVPLLIAIAVKVSSPHDNNGGPQFFNHITQNGIFVAFAALTAVLTFFLPLAVSVVAGDAVAGESHQGTLRYLLTVPVTRTRLLAVKYAGVVAFAFAATATVAVVGVAIGLILFPGDTVTLLSGTSVSLTNALGRLVLVVLYITASMAAFAAIGLFVSTLVEAPVAAIAATAGVAIASQILDNVPQLHAVGPYLLSHWWTSFGDLLRTPMETGGVVHGLVVTLVYVVFFCSLAWARFAEKDVSS
ncbi:MAG: ABC transporter permease [Mycobacteriales bacterium]|nr:MAG: ABC transporter permease [Pseudonocardiales bacterium]